MDAYIPPEGNKKDYQEWSHGESNNVKFFFKKKKAALLKFPSILLPPSYFKINLVLIILITYRHLGVVCLHTHVCSSWHM